MSGFYESIEDKANLNLNIYNPTYFCRPSLINLISFCFIEDHAKYFVCWFLLERKCSKMTIVSPCCCPYFCTGCVEKHRWQLHDTFHPVILCQFSTGQLKQWFMGRTIICIYPGAHCTIVSKQWDASERKFWSDVIQLMISEKQIWQLFIILALRFIYSLKLSAVTSLVSKKSVSI